MKRPSLDALTPVIGVTMVIGHLTAWAQHKTAALTLTGHELGEFTNFTPGAGVFANEWFYLPVWAAGLALALAAARARRSSAWLGLMALATGAAQFGLPRLERWTNPEFRLQFAATLVCLFAIAVLGIGLRLIKRADAKPIQLTASALPLLTVIPLAGFFVARSAIEALYRDTLAPGIGWWLCLAASAAAAIQTLLATRETRSRQDLPHPSASP
jgi:uncharacterized membrane protein HdeD (DUF308 family)